MVISLWSWVIILKNLLNGQLEKYLLAHNSFTSGSCSKVSTKTPSVCFLWTLKIRCLWPFVWLLWFYRRVVQRYTGPYLTFGHLQSGERNHIQLYNMETTVLSHWTLCFGPLIQPGASNYRTYSLRHEPTSCWCCICD